MVRERERISLPPTDGLLAAIKRGSMEHLGSKAKKRQGCGPRALIQMAAIVVGRPVVRELLLRL